MCGNDFFDPIPSHSHAHSYEHIPIPNPFPMVLYKNILIPSRNNTLILIPSNSHYHTWYSKFLTKFIT